MNCPVCGAKVSAGDVRCSICGAKLKEKTKGNFRGSVESIKFPKGVFSGSTGDVQKQNASRTHNNLEFALAIIATVYSIFPAFISVYDPNFIMAPISLIFGLIGSFIIRSHAKIGACILVVAVFCYMLLGAQGSLLVILLYVIAIIVAFVRN